MRQRLEAVPVLSELGGAARVLLLPRAYRRAHMDHDEASAILQRRLQRREDDFLELAEHAIYRHPSSPYYALLRVAGCELGDLKQLVHREGLEEALGVLYRKGVYIS